MLLNAVLKPTNRNVVTVNEKKVVSKTTIKDGINTCMVHITSINDFERVREERTQEFFDKKLPMQPYITAVGINISNLSEFYVSYGRVLLKFHSFVGALDTCFKIFHVFHLNYPTNSVLPWLFLQKNVFDFTTEYDIKSAALSEFMTNLNN